MELAQLSPRRALQKLDPVKPFEHVRLDILRAMDASDVQVFRDSPLIHDLISFVTTVGYVARTAVS